MLVQPDINELGDKRLDPKENVAKLREKCISMQSSKRLYKQDELEDPERAFGPRLSFGELIRRLKKIIPTLKALDGASGSVALYAPRTSQEVADNEQQWFQEQADAALRGRKRQDIFFLHHKYVGGFEKKELPEYSTVDIDNANLATKENRGWRSVLMTLIKDGVVSYRAVVNEFGDCGTDQRGWRWREQLQKYNN